MLHLCLGVGEFEACVAYLELVDVVYGLKFGVCVLG